MGVCVQFLSYTCSSTCPSFPSYKCISVSPKDWIMYNLWRRESLTAFHLTCNPRFFGSADFKRRWKKEQSQICWSRGSPSRSLNHEYSMHAPTFCRLFHADSIWTSFTIDWYCDMFSLLQLWNLGQERFNRIPHSLRKQSAAIGILNQFLWVRFQLGH